MSRIQNGGRERMKKKVVSLAKNILLAICSMIFFILILEGGAYLIIQSYSRGYYDPDARNSLGLRDPREPSEVRNKKVILILGDSFTYGTGVKYLDSYPAQLEKKLKAERPDNDYVVINAGSPGMDTQLAYRRLVEIFKYYEPEYVIVGFTSGDIIQNRIAYEHSRRASLKKRTGLVTNIAWAGNDMQDTIHEREKDMPILILIRSYLMINSNAAKIIAYYYKNYLIKYVKPPESLLNMSVGPDNEEEFEITARFLDKINIFLSGRGIKMVLLHVIPLFRFDSHPYDHINNALKNYADSRNVYFVNPFDAFSEYNSADLWVSMGDGHYNAKANGIMADILKNFFIENNLIANL